MEHRARAGRILTIALVVLVLVATGMLPAAAQAQRPVLRTRVTNAYPAYSPDGSKIAYMSNADGDFDIYVMAPDSGTVVKLTDAPGQDGTPAWSPDGRRIAFRSFRDGPSQIYVMDGDGSNQRNLSNSASHDEHPFWSPDGRRIFFASDRSAMGEDDENIDLYVMDADGSNVRRITSTPEIETYPTLSPDGTRLATRRILADGNWEVVVVDLQGNDIANLSNHPGFDGWPAWSPDGTRLVFASDRSGSSDLWIVDADGSNLQRLTDDPADDRQAWWSPDGSRIAFARYVWFPDEPFYEASEILEIDVSDATAEVAGYLPGAAGARIHYRVIGAGPDTVVAVHGGPGAGIDAIFPELEPLAEERTVIFYDQRGGGLSELPPDKNLLDARYFVEDLEAVRRFFGLEKMALIAHSFGSILVARYAQEHPHRVARMVFFGAVGPRWVDAAALARSAAARGSGALSKRLRDLTESLMSGASSDPVADCRERESIGRKLALARGASAAWKGTDCAMPAEAVRYYFHYTAQLTPRSFAPWDFTDSLGHVDAPLLVISGDLDPAIEEQQRAWAAAVPNGRLLLVPGAGKTASADQPAIFYPAVEAFLDGSWPAAAEAVR